jgi:hypothetical protein
MAQTGYTPIQLYYSSTTTNAPTAGNLANGELAINITDGKLFYKDNANAIQVIAWKTTPTSAGGTGLTSFTANGILYASSTSALATGSVLTFDGTTLTNNSNTVLGDAGTDTVLMNAAPSIGGAGYGMGMGFRNRIINGSVAVDQRNAGAAQTITAGAALAYTVDRWYAYSTGANVTGQQIAGTYSSAKYQYKFTGAASVTAIGFGQRIESANSFDLANNTATLSAFISNSLLTTVTWTAYYANTADTFGTLASPTVTSIATGTFTVTSTRTKYSANISIPSAATTGIQIVFSVGAQTSGTWIIDSIQLEKGATAIAYDDRPYGTELALCESYFQKTTIAGRRSGGFWIPENLASSNSMRGTYQYPVTMRAAPTGVITQDYLDGGYAGASYTFDDGLGSGLNKDAAVLLTDAYFVGGAGNYGTFVLTISLSAEL